MNTAVTTTTLAPPVDDGPPPPPSPSAPPQQPAPAPVPAKAKPSAEAASGASLARWLGEVVTLHARAKHALRVEVVHDLRVAIRRCRSLAQGLREIDDDAGAARWKALSDAGRPLFQGLGDLRDAQVMREHADHLLIHDPAHALVVDAIERRVASTKEGARAAVGAFTARAWRTAGEGLPARATALLRQRPLFDHLALRRFHEAKEMHQAAMRSRTSTALHELRIGVKKLRYTVENFLPDAHATVGKPLKRMQEVLGEVHDLDVLTLFLASEHAPLHSDDRSRCAGIVRQARDGLVQDYRALALGADSVWPRVRSAFAHGADVHRAHLALIIRKARGHGARPPAPPAARASRGKATAPSAQQASVQPAAPPSPRALERAALTLLHAFARELPHDERAVWLLRGACALAFADGGGKSARKLARRLPLAVGFGERERELLGLAARAAVDDAAAHDDPRVLALTQRDRKLAVALSAVIHLAVELTRVAPFSVSRSRSERAAAGGVVVLRTARSFVDARAFGERRAPLEALVGVPIWWQAGP